MIEREDDGDIAVLRLAHGPVSAMDIELCQGITEQFRSFAGGTARAVVLTGTGRSFSAGVDLHRYLDGGAPYVEAFLPALCEMFQTAFEQQLPVVSALNGHAIAGGCVLAACADATLMADGAGRVGLPEVRVGLPFPRVAVEIMRYAVGDVAARRLMVGALTHPPAEALAIGLVDRIVSAEELRDQAIATARALADEVPPDTFAVTKVQLRRESLDRVHQYADEHAAATQLWSRRSTDGWTRRYLDDVTAR